MTVLLGQLLRQSRRRAALRVLAFASPPAFALVAIGARFGGAAWAWTAAPVATAIACALALVAVRRIDRRWLARRLDERDPRMEDSAPLLFLDPAQATVVQKLQRDRLLHRLQQSAPPDLRPAWPARRLFACVIASAALAVLASAWPDAADMAHTGSIPPATQAAPARPGHTRITDVRLDIAPPAYTGLPARDEAGFEAKVPEGATVRWTLRFSPQPSSASLAFHDGQHVALVREGDHWSAARRIDKPLLYRIAVEAAPPLQPDRLYRLDATPDQPPRIEGLAPEETLTLRREGQRTWTVSFKAQDDYGLSASGPLRITLAQGEGESIRFEERSLTLTGRGTATRKRYAHTFDLAALGLTPGSDFVVQLAVTDNRAAGPQTTRSASYILRWPPEDATQTTGLEGAVKKAIPAYFRSQRQIIIDSEALLAQRRKLPADAYLARSDSIGVDQRLLRLRYGQFLGEESEGAPPAPTTSARRRDCTQVGPLLPTAEAEAEADAARRACEEAAAQAEQAGHAEESAGDGHAHDAGQAQPQQAFGSEVDVLSDYGHAHDDAEAATLLDPETRRTLKAALDQMWQAELHLRQGHPDLALPFEYKALDYIKQVQQAGRIYLARVGSELPPIDESRRMSGERKGLAAGGDPLAPATPTSPLLENLWRALQAPPGP